MGRHINSQDCGQNSPLTDIATHHVASFPPSTSIGTTAQWMAEHRISSIVVNDDTGRPLGIVTERNILRAMQVNCASDTPISTLMSAPAICVSPDISCLDAYQICMRESIRHLVLIDEQGKTCGIVSETDFRLHMNLAALAGRRLVASAMSRSVLSLAPHASLQEALNLMQSQRNCCVVITEAQRPLGIITERDVVKLYANQQALASTPLSEVMTTPVATILIDTTLNEAAERMLSRKFRHLVAIDHAGILAGVVSEHDLTESLTASLIDSHTDTQSSFLHTLIDTLPDLVWLKNTEGVYLACNRRFEHFFGHKEAHIVGKTDYDFVDAQLADFFRENDRKAIEIGGPSINEESLTFASDGYRGLFETIKTPMHDQNGHLIGVLGVARDITERKRMTEQLDAYRQRLEGQVLEESTKFRALIEQSLVGIYIIQHGLFPYVNQGFVDMFGYDSAEQIIDKIPFLQLVSPKDRAMVTENVRLRQVGEIESIRYSFTGIKRDGSPIIIEVHGRRIEYRGTPAVIGSLVDISEARRSQDELERLVREKSLKLHQSEEKLRTLIEAIPDAIQFKDGDGRWIESNQAARRAFALDEIPYHGKTDDELATLADPRFRSALLQCRQTDQYTWAKRSLTRIEEVMPLPDGTQLTFDVIKIPLFQPDGAPKGLVIIGRDITELKQAENALRVTASVFENSQEAIIITDAKNHIVDTNPAFTRITGFSRAEVLGKRPNVLSSGRQNQAFYANMWQSLQTNKAWRGEIWNRRKSGGLYAELLSISVVSDAAGNVLRYVGIFSDITHLKAHEAELNRVANYDALTGIPNRRLLSDRLSQSIARSERSHRALGVCYLDLDGFKAVNDAFGHDQGDELLIEASKRLQSVLRAGDTLARLGGDEFVLLLAELAHERECIHVLQRIHKLFSEPFLLGEDSVSVSVSIGVTLYPHDHEDGDTLLRHADQAMYVAKQAGKNRHHLYDPGHEQRMRSRQERLHRIRHGLAHHEFELFLQPKIAVSDHRIQGAEALARWHHPTEGLLLPGEFLPILESTEMELTFGDWVIDQALEQLAYLRRAGLSLEISINISAKHLQSAGFLSDLQSKLARHPDFVHGSLQIEVLESAALEDISHTAQIISACQDLGVSFALDDFGTGYSSLTYLRSLPAKTLKIDQSFVRTMLDNPGDQAIVQGIVALAQTFSRDTIAEGVETEAQLAALRQFSCQQAQGFGIARPMPINELLLFAKK